LNYPLATPTTNKLAFILHEERIFLKDRPPAQTQEGSESEVRIECVVHADRWIDLDDNLPRIPVVKTNDI
jgi:hypothetical protein